MKTYKANFVFVSQKVKDIKIPPNNPELLLEMGKLRSGLRKHSFIPGNKIPTDLRPVCLDQNGVFFADIPGRQLSSDLDSSIHVRFPLQLVDYHGPLDIESVFSSAEGVTVDDGGNVQNMSINILLAVVHAKLGDLMRERGVDLSITIATNGDPFQRLPSRLAETITPHAHVFPMDLPTRFSIQAPYDYQGESGTLAIASEPARTKDAIERLVTDSAEFRKVFKRATNIISSDPIYDQLAEHVDPPYSHIINASSAFRSLVATQSYKRSVILPMNAGEAADVLRLLLQRKFSEELDEIKIKALGSPLTSDGAQIDAEALAVLDHSLEQFRTYVPLERHHNRIGIACPITFEVKGGLLVSSGREDLACFTSTPHPNKEQRLLEEFGDDEEIDMSRIHEVGAGDSSASMITLFESIEPKIFLEQHMAGREQEDGILLEVASIIFVSVLSRIAGNFLVRTKKTSWQNIHPNKFRSLFDETAKEALGIGRRMFNGLDQPQILELKRWGIQVALWRLGKIAFPERNLP